MIFVLLYILSAALHAQDYLMGECDSTRDRKDSDYRLISNPKITSIFKSCIVYYAPCIDLSRDLKADNDICFYRQLDHLH